ncbi:MAG: DUF2333 family protein [Gammaproteobacteria bacterium]|nr:DUF2333 family protein [Gammaproteobacteria bacterium]
MNWKPWHKVATEGIDADANAESVEDTGPGPSRRWPWQRFEYVYATPKGVLASLSKSLWRAALAVAGALAVVVLVLGWWWSYEPDAIDIVALAQERAAAAGVSPVTGYTTATAVVFIGETLLDKRGGYLSNDVSPPGLYLDNTPNWEFGALVHLRDISRALRNDISRSQSQSTEDPDLAVAEGHFFFDNASWLLPATESEYRDGIGRIRSYAERLANPAEPEAQFYARADNLSRWLIEVERRLGDISQRLSQSVGKRQLNLDLAGETAARMATDAPADVEQRTSWFRIDDVFYEARGQTWALVHLLKAVEHDFAAVLEDKNARVSLQQIIRELEETQHAIWSPVILNGSGFGFVANHSLVMASYISRVNAALIDLRSLLDRG